MWIQKNLNHYMAGSNQDLWGCRCEGNGGGG